MLPELIRDALAEASASGRMATNDEIADLVIRKIGDDDLREALQQAMSALIPQVRNQENKRLLRPPTEEGRLPVPAVAGSITPDGPRYSTMLGAVLAADRLLQFTITGTGNRALPLGKATLADLRHEIDISHSKGQTLLERAAIFEELQKELAASGHRTVASLPAVSREKYARRLADIYS